ncbi:hypothetical protein B1H58_16255 [Pantoea alhagi]|uniref:CTP synthase (glutamine hydrolyzing) n=1 Tax=Pantoea alhagi TaxID=1891675 RepID=A0A1W6B8J7_9GAMM|nr:CTP synthase [Pantoea alhagi]ARJ43435.1 hypothetical protein B1H58_16255 [Pantoea alhagi]
MSAAVRLALVGDYRPSAVAHQAIPLAIPLALSQLNITASWDWLPTTSIHNADALTSYDAIWLVPGSPYQHDRGAFTAIRWAREQQVPFLGSCGGFQYALVEYARNVMGWHDAGHAETDQAGRLVITPLACSLVEKTGDVQLVPGSRIADAYGSLQTHEGYHCNFGVNPDFIRELEAFPLRISAHDMAGDARAIELPDHRFFVATLFQSERAALRQEISPLVLAWIKAAAARN